MLLELALALTLNSAPLAPAQEAVDPDRIEQRVERLRERAARLESGQAPERGPGLRGRFGAGPRRFGQGGPGRGGSGLERLRSGQGQGSGFGRGLGQGPGRRQGQGLGQGGEGRLGQGGKLLLKLELLQRMRDQRSGGERSGGFAGGRRGGAGMDRLRDRLQQRGGAVRGPF